MASLSSHYESLRAPLQRLRGAGNEAHVFLPRTACCFFFFFFVEIEVHQVWMAILPVVVNWVRDFAREPWRYHIVGGLVSVGRGAPTLLCEAPPCYTFGYISW